MPASRLDVDHHHASLLQCGEVLGHAGLASADCLNDIAPRCRPISGQESENFVARPVAEGGDGSLDIGRPGLVMWLRNSWHNAILPELNRKSKNSTLDDTLSIFDNNLCSFCLIVVGSPNPRTGAAFARLCELLI
ncbi:hypothetical protein QFZ35_003187 [Arthrobacter ulcerisalmonis]|nr:hypothetical protein [Arthrobacter ulcerisalmonis]MDQ0664689.1 hypothetical protein [Arthrobacter ulcerisalmonis]